MEQQTQVMCGGSEGKRGAFQVLTDMLREQNERGWVVVAVVDLDHNSIGVVWQRKS